MARILLIEDNPANMDLMVYLLRAFGHETIEAREGQLGVEAARLQRPDLILCDLQLPDIDGYEVARQLKSDPVLRRIPLVAVTAYAMVGDRDRVLAAGFNGYFTKPIVPEAFEQQLEAFLRPDLRPTQPHPSHAPVGPALRPPARATVLVVDDVQVNIDLLRSILEPSGYTVVAAYSVREAAAYARRSPPDVIVSDLRMPDEDGYELLRIVKADPALSGIPVIIHSASVFSLKEQAAVLAQGAARVAQVPIEPHAMLAALAACLPQEAG